MTGRAIQGDILFEAGHIAPTDTEAEKECLPVLPDRRNCNNTYIYYMTYELS